MDCAEMHYSPQTAVNGSFRIFRHRSVHFFDLDSYVISEFLELFVQLLYEFDIGGRQSLEHVHNILRRFDWLVRRCLFHAAIFEALPWMLVMRQLHR